MTGGDFLNGLVGLTSWIGYLILPVLAAYCVVAALVAWHHRGDGQRYILAALACLMGPGLALLARSFTTLTPASSSHDAFYNALLNMINWFGNVIMPMFGVYNVVCGILVMGGFMERFNIGDDWARYFLVAFGCMMVSGIIRLLEWFVINGASTSLQHTSSLLVLGGGGALWL
jgi:hypothetical protein